MKSRRLLTTDSLRGELSAYKVSLVLTLFTEVKWTMMYLCAMGIDLPSSFLFTFHSIGFWNCSGSLLIFFFFCNILHSTHSL